MDLLWRSSCDCSRLLASTLARVAIVRSTCCMFFAILLERFLRSDYIIALGFLLLVKDFLDFFMGK